MGTYYFKLYNAYSPYTLYYITCNVDNIEENSLYITLVNANGQTLNYIFTAPVCQRTFLSLIHDEESRHLKKLIFFLNWKIIFIKSFCNYDEI